jgi:DNA-directed RNA polymerase subunit RPC12/RpoP
MKTETEAIENLIKKLTDELAYGITQVGMYKQFKQVEAQPLLTVLCPTCNKYFGLSTEFVEYIGELSYLRPYTCPYCSSSYTLKDE